MNLAYFYLGGLKFHLHFLETENICLTIMRYSIAIFSNLFEIFLEICQYF